MAIKIFLRHYQMVNIYGTAIVYTGASPATVKAVAGTVPQSTFIDFSSDVDDITKISLSWSIDSSGPDDTYGSSGIGIKKTSSGTIGITGAAYKFVKDWCVNHVAAPFNAIEVRIQNDCGTFDGYKIEAEQLRWCEGESICQFDVNLNQVDTALQCIQRTQIADNHLGWFQERPEGGKKHPRFSYCNEHRPNGLLVILWLIMALNTPLILLLFAIYLVVLVIINVINIIIGVITTIVAAITSLLPGFLGVAPTKPEWNAIPEYEVDAFIKAIEQYYTESTGCGREHPAPLIRDYIYNVCAKCGLQVDAVTAPIFFSPTWNIDFITSTGENLRGQQNPYFNACYLNAPVSKGIRRFTSLNFFSAPPMDDTTFYIKDNRPTYALNDFLDEIKGAFNAEWRVKNGRLYFWRKDWYQNGAVLYDFRTSSADRTKILEGVCFEWNGVRRPAYSSGLLSQDPIDTCGNEAMSQMNGVGGAGLVTYGQTETNPVFEGEDDRYVQIGATKFRQDGASGDYIYDAMQTVVNIGFIAFWLPAVMRKVDTWVSQYSNYALLMRDETCQLPKIIIWNGERYLNAQSVFDKVPATNRLTTTETVPTINPDYNPDYSNNFTSEIWPVRHQVRSRVLGNSITGSGSTLGIYEVKGVLGGLIAQNAARLVNYPMYYEPGYKGTLWDLFHYIDDPRKNPGLSLNFEVKIEACCPDAKKLGLLGTADNIQLGGKILVDNGYYTTGIIKEIEFKQDPADELGSYINLKGTL